MKKLMVSFVFILGITLVSFAQGQQHGDADGHKGPDTPEECAERKTKKLKKDLFLSANQTEKIRQVLLKECQNMDNIHSKYASSTDKSAMKTEMDKVKTQADTELKAIFTPEQYTKYETMMKEEHKKNGEHHGGEHHGGGMH